MTYKQYIFIMCMPCYAKTRLWCAVFDACLSRPCLNSGTCEKMGRRYQCTCVGTFSGTNCQRGCRVRGRSTLRQIQIHTHRHARARAHTHTHTHTYIHTRTHAYTHTHACTHKHTRTHARTHTQVHTRIHTHAQAP